MVLYIHRTWPVSKTSLKLLQTLPICSISLWKKTELASGIYAIKCRISKMRPTSNCSIPIFWRLRGSYHRCCIFTLIFRADPFSQKFWWSFPPRCLLDPTIDIQLLYPDSNYGSAYAQKLTSVQNEPKTITNPSNMLKLFLKKDWIGIRDLCNKCRISKMSPTNNCSGWMTEVGYLVLHQSCVVTLICLCLYNVSQWWAKRKTAQPYICLLYTSPSPRD